MAISADRVKTMIELIAKENGLKYDLLIDQLAAKDGLLPKKLLNDHFLKPLLRATNETKKTPKKEKVKPEPPVFASKVAEELAKTKPSLVISKISRSGKKDKITLKDVKDAIECQCKTDSDSEYETESESESEC